MPASLWIEPVPSRRGAAVFLGLWLTVLMLLPVSGARYEVQWAVLLVASGGCLQGLWACGWPASRRRMALVHDAGAWRLRRMPGADWKSVRLRSDYLVWSWLVLLRFELDGRTATFVLWPDRVPADALRRLRVLLRWNPALLGAATQERSGGARMVSRGSGSGSG